MSTATITARSRNLREAQGVVNAFDKKLDIAMWALKDEGYIGRARNH